MAQTRLAHTLTHARNMQQQHIFPFNEFNESWNSKKLIQSNEIAHSTPIAIGKDDGHDDDDDDIFKWLENKFWCFFMLRAFLPTWLSLIQCRIFCACTFLWCDLRVNVSLSLVCTVHTD